jgi:hypothetical protein
VQCGLRFANAPSTRERYHPMSAHERAYFCNLSISADETG